MAEIDMDIIDICYKTEAQCLAGMQAYAINIADQIWKSRWDHREERLHTVVESRKTIENLVIKLNQLKAAQQAEVA